MGHAHWSQECPVCSDMGIKFLNRAEQAPPTDEGRADRIGTDGLDHVYLSTETADVEAIPETGSEPLEPNAVVVRQHADGPSGDALLAVISEQSGKLMEQASRIGYLNFRVGFLEGVVQMREEQVRLLPDFRARAAAAILQERLADELEKNLAAAEAELGRLNSTWWVRFMTWFLNGNRK